MTVVKRSVAFIEEVAAEADQIAGDRGFSRLVNEAVERYLQARRINALYVSHVAEHGPISDNIRKSVADEWASIDQLV
jgi:translation elongation factor EF-Ts